MISSFRSFSCRSSYSSRGRGHSAAGRDEAIPKDLRRLQDDVANLDDGHPGTWSPTTQGRCLPPAGRRDRRGRDLPQGQDAARIASRPRKGPASPRRGGGGAGPRSASCATRSAARFRPRTTGRCASPRGPRSCVRLEDPLSSRTARREDRFDATVVAPRAGRGRPGRPGRDAGARRGARRWSRGAPVARRPARARVRHALPGVGSALEIRGASSPRWKAAEHEAGGQGGDRRRPRRASSGASFDGKRGRDRGSARRRHRGGGGDEGGRRRAARGHACSPCGSTRTWRSRRRDAERFARSAARTSSRATTRSRPRQSRISKSDGPDGAAGDGRAGGVDQDAGLHADLVGVGPERRLGRGDVEGVEAPRSGGPARAATREAPGPCRRFFSTASGSMSKVSSK